MQTWPTGSLLTNQIQLSGYSLAHLRDLLRQKKIKAEKRGGHYWIDRESILEFTLQASETGQEDKRHGAKGKRTP